MSSTPPDGATTVASLEWLRALQQTLQKSHKVKRSRRGLPKSTARVGDLLPSLMVRHGFHRLAAGERLQAAWRDAVGADIAAVTNIGQKRRGVLDIFVPHHAYIQELSFRERDFVAALAVSVPEEEIKKLRFKTQ